MQCIDYKDPKKRVVAIKISKNKKFDVDNANVEIKIIKKLNDAQQNENIIGAGSIVEMKDHFRFRQHVVIVFEILHKNLYNYLKQYGFAKNVMGATLLKRVGLQIVQGLFFMKKKSVIHCDMKPENILFTDESCQNIKIIDFGASCENYSQGFFYVQSRYYRAPEILLGNQYDWAVDMWSLGCILYELITGKPLFPAKDENELLEYWIVTIHKMPVKLLKTAKKYKQFYSKATLLNPMDYSYGHVLKRSKYTQFNKDLGESTHPLESLLLDVDGASPEVIDFIKQCLMIDP
jgi:serine/threonine protein kinase